MLLIDVTFFFVCYLAIVTDASTGFLRPTFTEPIPNVTVAVGRDAVLPCVVDNLGTHRVAWVHLDRQMIVTIHRQVVTRISRFSVSHDHQRTWLLHIRGAQPEDAGHYMCQVNSDPMVSQVGTVYVVVPPSFIDSESSPSQLSVRENSRVSLICRGHGVPPPRLNWKREDGRSFIEGHSLARQPPAKPTGYFQVRFELSDASLLSTKGTINYRSKCSFIFGLSTT